MNSSQVSIRPLRLVTLNLGIPQILSDLGCILMQLQEKTRMNIHCMISTAQTVIELSL